MKINGDKIFPGLEKFMRNYWMETTDLVFGDIAGAAIAFAQFESKEMISSLLLDLDRIRSLGLFIDDSSCNEDMIDYWKSISPRNMLRHDALIVCDNIKDYNSTN